VRAAICAIASLEIVIRPSGEWRGSVDCGSVSAATGITLDAPVAPRGCAVERLPQFRRASVADTLQFPD
jgi:hypothetical protein